MDRTLSTMFAPANREGLAATAILLGVVIAGLLIQRALFAVLLRFAQRRNETIFAALVRRAAAPAAFAFPLLATLVALPGLRFPPLLDVALLRVTSIATVVAVTWGIVASIALYTDLVKRRYKIDVEDNLRARQVETRIDILARTITVLVVVIGAALAAMTFPAIRALGTTLLASAGVAGLIVGLAARPLFENLVAGVQLALTQPIRIDDVVIVEGEFGHIEQIGATFVVVRIWDQRRMVVPLTYFIEKPFQNWTRTGAALIGSVFVYVDYRVPVAAVRAQLPKLLETAKLWDGAVCNLQVTDAKERALELRVLVSARNSADLWDLRCDVRERLVAWLQEAYPSSLPVVRYLDAGTGARDGVGPPYVATGGSPGA